MRISKTFEFEAAHRLPLHEGKCSRPHGHSYKLEVELSGSVCFEPISECGMVMDFARLKDIVTQNVLRLCDHYDLNKILPECYDVIQDPDKVNVTTAENMACLFGVILNDRVARLGLPCCVSRVRLHETRSSFAEWTKDDDSRPTISWLLGNRYYLSGDQLKCLNK